MKSELMIARFIIDILEILEVSSSNQMDRNLE